MKQLQRRLVNDLVPDIVRIGLFLVNVNVVSKQSLKAMRTYWPKELYRMIKNRKSARISRERRKQHYINDLYSEGELEIILIAESQVNGHR